jgi:hypothetical protein
VIFTIDGIPVECIKSRHGISTYKARIPIDQGDGRAVLVPIGFVVDWREQSPHAKTADILRATMNDRLEAVA